MRWDFLFEDILITGNIGMRRNFEPSESSLIAFLVSTAK